MPWHCSVPGATQALMIHASLSIASLQSRPEAQFDLTLLGAARVEDRTKSGAHPIDGHVNITSLGWIQQGKVWYNSIHSLHRQLPLLWLLSNIYSAPKGLCRNPHVVSLSFTAAVLRVTRASSSETDVVLPYASAWHSTAGISWHSS